MYEHSPVAYDILHAARGKDYSREAALVAAHIRRHRPQARSLLDVACGTGRHLAAFVQLGFGVEGVELSAAMIAEATKRVPGVAVHEGDMRTFRLPRRFDAVVCLFSAIGYMTDLDQLGAAVARMADHLVDGGVLAVEPWLRPETWHEGDVFAESETVDGLAVARVSRSWREGEQSLIEMLWTVASPERTWAFTEIHRMGLFSTKAQVEVLRAAGLAVEHDERGPSGRGLLVGVKPG